MGFLLQFTELGYYVLTKDISENTTVIFAYMINCCRPRHLSSRDMSEQ